MFRILIACVFFFVNSSQSSAVISKNEDFHKEINTDASATCVSSGCKDKLSDFISSNVKPCDDFFKYACDGWIAKNPIPKDQSKWYSYTALRKTLSSKISAVLTEENHADDPMPVKQARDFYAACMNKDERNKIGLGPLVHFLEAVDGGWPMAGVNSREIPSKQKILVGIPRLYEKGVLLNIYNFADEKTVDTNRIYIDQTTLILSREMLLDQESDSSKPVINAYKKFVKEAARVVSAALQGGSHVMVSDAKIESDVTEMLEFEKKLALITSRNDIRHDANRMYNLMSLSELQKSSGSIINWKELLNDIYSGIVGITITDDVKVVVVETNYIQEFVKLLNETDSRTIQNYVYWRIVYEFSGKLNDAMGNLLSDFNKVKEGNSGETPLSETCSAVATKYFGFAISNKVVASKLPDIKQIITMVNNMKNQLTVMIGNADWMDESTKKKATDKVTQMIENIGYPEWIMDKNQLEVYYHGLTVSTEYYFTSYQSASAFDNTLKLKKLTQTRDKTIWTDFPTDVNAFYYRTFNKVVVTFAFLDLPFYMQGRFAALNYGALGFFIGHELSHAFDNNGVNYDSSGLLSNWWSEQSRIKYNAKADCLVKQFGNYAVLKDGTKLNGKRTLGENIADNIALRAAFLAYNKTLNKEADPKLSGLEGLSSEKIFFLGFASSFCGSENDQYLRSLIQKGTHTPSHLRINGVLRNSKEFAEVFGCTPESYMNPEEKCLIFDK